MKSSGATKGVTGSSADSAAGSEPGAAQISGAPASNPVTPNGDHDRPIPVRLRGTTRPYRSNIIQMKCNPLARV